MSKAVTKLLESVENRLSIEAAKLDGISEDVVIEAGIIMLFIAAVTTKESAAATGRVVSHTLHVVSH